MRFIDPFAILQYLGGATSFHLAMMAYSSWVLFCLKDELKCYKEARNVKVATMYDDVWKMLVAHILCAFF